VEAYISGCIFAVHGIDAFAVGGLNEISDITFSFPLSLVARFQDLHLKAEEIIFFAANLHCYTSSSKEGRHLELNRTSELFCKSPILGYPLVSRH
jgi:hypothetical protein